MRKFILLVLFLLFQLTFSPNVDAQTDWKISQFQSDIAILKDGTVHIRETITVDFFSQEKHGIYRDIPYVYQTAPGESKYTTLTIHEITRDGRSETFEKTDNSTNIRLKIGDPQTTISGQHTYEIDYRVQGVIVPYSNYDEVYWNVTGNDWEVPIEKIQATLHLPQPGIIQTTCYFGKMGSTSQCRDIRISDQEARFSVENLSPGEGMTIATGFQKNLVPILTPPRPRTFFERSLDPLNLLLFFGTTLVGGGYILRKWWREGRDSWTKNIPITDTSTPESLLPIGAHETISVEFTPPDGLKPAEMGVLMDEKADTLDVTATIIDLAQRGFLSVEEIKKTWALGKTDYILHRLTPTKGSLAHYEEELLDRLFNSKKEVKLSSLKLTFYDDLKKVKEKLYQDMTDKKLFGGNPEKIRQKYLVSGIFITIFPLILFSILGTILISPPLVMLGSGIGLTGILLSIFSQKMPRRTAQGRDLYRRSQGYRLFISGAEKYRQQFYEKHNLFNEVLPYTIIFGLTDKFAKAMKDIGLEPKQPGWYTGYSTFNASSFTRSMNSFSKTLSTTMAAAPSSSGSGGRGSSGGGFGGGGGGSW